MSNPVAQFSHAFFIDEAGKGADFPGLNRLWVASAVCIPFDYKATVDVRIKEILASHFHAGQAELKGSFIPKNLLQKSSTSDVAREVGELLDSTGARTWVVATEFGCHLPANLSHLVERSPKAIVRQLLMERLNGFLRFGGHTNNFLMVWDITDQQELRDFSRSVASFKNSVRGDLLSPLLAPAVLGGLSHDWSGLQVADIVANYALHRIGFDRQVEGAHQGKARDFDMYFRHRLHKDPKGQSVGWKVF